MKQPNIQVLLDKLNGILNGVITRDDVSTWSLEIIDNDDVEINDLKAWELLKVVGSIDLYDSPDTFLYTDEDIRKWISEYSS